MVWQKKIVPKKFDKLVELMEKLNEFLQLTQNDGAKLMADDLLKRVKGEQCYCNNDEVDQGMLTAEQTRKEGRKMKSSKSGSGSRSGSTKRPSDIDDQLRRTSGRLSTKIVYFDPSAPKGKTRRKTRGLVPQRLPQQVVKQLDGAWDGLLSDDDDAPESDDDESTPSTPPIVKKRQPFTAVWSGVVELELIFLDRFLHKAPGDGDCLFTSFARGCADQGLDLAGVIRVGVGTVVTAAMLREFLANWLISNVYFIIRAGLADMVTESGEKYDAVIEHWRTEQISTMKMAPPLYWSSKLYRKAYPNAHSNFGDIILEALETATGFTARKLTPGQGPVGNLIVVVSPSYDEYPIAHPMFVMVQTATQGHWDYAVRNTTGVRRSMAEFPELVQGEKTVTDVDAIISKKKKSSSDMEVLNNIIKVSSSKSKPDTPLFEAMMNDPLVMKITAQQCMETFGYAYLPATNETAVMAGECLKHVQKSPAPIIKDAAADHRTILGGMQQVSVHKSKVFGLDDPAGLMVRIDAMFRQVAQTNKLFNGFKEHKSCGFKILRAAKGQGQQPYHCDSPHVSQEVECISVFLYTGEGHSTSVPRVPLTMISSDASPDELQDATLALHPQYFTHRATQRGDIMILNQAVFHHGMMHELDDDRIIGFNIYTTATVLSEDEGDYQFYEWMLYADAFGQRSDEFMASLVRNRMHSPILRYSSSAQQKRIIRSLLQYNIAQAQMCIDANSERIKARETEVARIQLEDAKLLAQMDTPVHSFNAMVKLHRETIGPLHVELFVERPSELFVTAAAPSAGYAVVVASDVNMNSLFNALALVYRQSPNELRSDAKKSARANFPTKAFTEKDRIASMAFDAVIGAIFSDRSESHSEKLEADFKVKARCDLANGDEYESQDDPQPQPKDRPAPKKMSISQHARIDIIAQYDLHIVSKKEPQCSHDITLLNMDSQPTSYYHSVQLFRFADLGDAFNFVTFGRRRADVDKPTVVAYLVVDDDTSQYALVGHRDPKVKQGPYSVVFGSKQSSAAEVALMIRGRAPNAEDVDAALVAAREGNRVRNTHAHMPCTHAMHTYMRCDK